MSGPRKARGRDVASKVRDAFDKALERLGAESGGVIALSEIIEECLTQDAKTALSTLDTISRFIPKELLIDMEDDGMTRVIAASSETESEWFERHGNESTH